MKITLQQIIDAAWQKFIVEDAPPAVGSDGLCDYRVASGARCAVGPCLPEAGYSFTGSFSGVVREYPSLFDSELVAMARGDYALKLDSFQRRLHDGLQSHGQWLHPRDDRARQYRNVAESYGLTLPNGGVMVTP
jgi:hypothetical protein